MHVPTFKLSPGFGFPHRFFLTFGTCSEIDWTDIVVVKESTLKRLVVQLFTYFICLITIYCQSNTEHFLI